VIIAMAFAQSAVVLTAAHDLPVGHVLRADDLRSVAVGDFPVPVGAATQTGAVGGRSLRVPVFRGEVLRGEYLGEVQTVPASLIPSGHWLVPLDVRSTADDTDLVKLSAGGFCAAVRTVQVVLSDAGLVAVAASDVSKAAAAMGPDASVRRADPGLRDCH
jgi:hypothetical protein